MKAHYWSQAAAKQDNCLIPKLHTFYLASGDTCRFPSQHPHHVLFSLVNFKQFFSKFILSRAVSVKRQKQDHTAVHIYIQNWLDRLVIAFLVIFGVIGQIR